MRMVALPGPAFEEEGNENVLSGFASTGSSSSYIVSLLIRLGLLMDFAWDFWEVDEGVPPTLCFLVTGLGSSSVEVCFVLRRFRFLRESSSSMCELLLDLREITGESGARLLDTRGVRELLELLLVGLLEVDVADARDPLRFPGTDGAVSIHPKAERSQAHLDGYFSSSWLSLRPKPRRDPQLPLISQSS